MHEKRPVLWESELQFEHAPVDDNANSTVNYSTDTGYAVWPEASRGNRSRGRTLVKRDIFASGRLPASVGWRMIASLGDQVQAFLACRQHVFHGNTSEQKAVMVCWAHVYEH